MWERFIVTNISKSYIRENAHIYGQQRQTWHYVEVSVAFGMLVNCTKHGMGHSVSGQLHSERSNLIFVKGKARSLVKDGLVTGHQNRLPCRDPSPFTFSHNT